MSRSYGKTDEIITLVEHEAIGLPKGSELDNIVDGIDSRLTFSCQVKATSPNPDALINIGNVETTLADGRKIRVPVSFAFTGATINTQTAAVTGNIASFVMPSGTIGQYVTMGLALSEGGDILVTFNNVGNSAGGDGEVGFAEGAIKLSLISLENTDGASAWKGEGAASNVVENNDITQYLSSGGNNGSGSGLGGGGELVDLDFKVKMQDTFSAIPDGTVPTDISAGKTDASLHSVVNKYFRLNYDAGKTITGSGTANYIISSAPAFTISVGCLIIIGSEIRRITAVNSQTDVNIDAAFTTDPSATAFNVSQAVYTKDLNAYAGDGIAPSSQYSGNIDDMLVHYADSETLDDVIPDYGTAPVIAFDMSADGINYSDLKVRPTSLSDEASFVSSPVSGTNLYLRFFANKTSGAGLVNLISYKVFFHAEVSELGGTELFSAFSRPGSGIDQNCTHSVVGGKSRFVFNVAFGRGLLDGEAASSALEVMADGKAIPRWKDGTIVNTSQAYFKELDDVTIEMDSDYSATAVQFMFKVPRLIIDSSNNNASRIARAENFHEEAFQDFVIEGSKIDVPHTTIVNRAQIPNLANDLKPRMGIERIMTQGVVKLQDEFGVNGENVYGAINDTINQFRFYGEWETRIDGYGPKILANPSGSKDAFVEIVFYGTGLNMLECNIGDGLDLFITVDGGVEGSDILPNGFSGVLNNRNYNSNIVMPLVSGLSLGIHTIKLRTTTNGWNMLSGFEILNEASTVNFATGNAFVNRKKVAKSSVENLAYKPSGIVGTRGAHVLNYMNSDGSIGQTFTETDTTQKNLTLADHSNEEVIRTYNWREFGANRADDFSTLAGTISPRAFTLDDGTTTLVANNAVADTSNTLQLQSGVPYFWTLTFIGTGLDIVGFGSAAAVSDTDIYVNGVNVGKMGTLVTIEKTYRICSGLPYGTHTVGFYRNAGNYVYVSNFKVYGPKKPTLPSNAIELGSYYLMGDFVANTVAGLNTISQGTLRKNTVNREAVYTGSWAIFNAAPSMLPGNYVQSSATNSTVQYTFFGTGFDFRFYPDPTHDASTVLNIDGSTNHSSLTTSLYHFGGGCTFTPATGVLNNGGTSGSGAGLVISGLSLGLHTVTFTTGSASNFLPHVFDIITPIHSPKSNLPASLQNTLPVGSNAIADLREFTAIKENIVDLPNYAKAQGVSSGPSTTSTTYIPMPDMSVVVKTSGKPIEINFDGACRNSSGATAAYVAIYVNGIQLKEFGSNNSTWNPVNLHTIKNVSAGVHKVDVFWKATGSTAYMQLLQRELTVQEIK